MIALRLPTLVVALQAVAFGLIPSSVDLSASPNPATYGRTVTLTATVPAGATGKVTFYDGTTMLGITAVSAGRATLTTVMLASGERSLRAYYRGDTTYAPSSSAPLAQAVVAGASLGLRHPVSYPLSATPDLLALGSIAVADFNGDGKPDMASVSFASGLLNWVHVFIGNGDGTFQPGVNYSVDSSSNSVAIGDFNGDGRPDLIVGSAQGSLLLLGNGDGTFQPALSYAPALVAPVVADLNGDGKTDLYYGTLSNLGNGTAQNPFSRVLYYPVGAPLAVGDFNGDGKPDVVAQPWGSSGLVVLLGNGDGAFAPPVYYPAGGVVSVAVGDFNGDGVADLVVSDSNRYVSVLLGNGDGSFGASLKYDVGSLPGKLVVEDFDGDGNADVAFTGDHGTVGVLPGNGDGTFKTAALYPSGAYPYALATGDFNGDGIPDLVVANALGNDGLPATFSVLLGGAMVDLSLAVAHSEGFSQGQVGAAYTVTVGNTGGLISRGPVSVTGALASGFSATSIAGAGWNCVLADLACTRADPLADTASYPPIRVTVNVAGSFTGTAINTFTVSGGHDGNLANNAVSDTVQVRLLAAATLAVSPNPAALGQPVTLTATLPGGATGNVTFYDGATILGAVALAGGQAVLVTALLPSGVRSLRVAYGGDSNYGPSISPVRLLSVAAAAANGLWPSTSYKVDSAPEAVVAADFNGDGKLDLAVASRGGVSVLLGNGDGTFRPAVKSPAGSWGFPRSAVAGDFNGDGKRDLAVATDNGLYLFPGNGDGTLGPPVTLSFLGSANTFRSLGTADFNGDGKLDLVLLKNSGSYLSGAILLYLGNGDGTFQTPVTVTAGSFFDFLGIGDVNGDGRADLIAVNKGEGTLSVLLGYGDGTFQPAVKRFFSGFDPMAFAVGDFNGDGKTDVVVVSPTNAQLLLGNGDGSLRPPLSSPLNIMNDTFTAAGDFNGDGKLDIAYSQYYGNRLILAYGNGDGTFQPGVSLSTDATPTGLVLGDFNGDGKPDFAVTSYGTTNGGASTVSVFSGGQFSGLSTWSRHAGEFVMGLTGLYQIVVRNSTFASIGGTVTVTDTLPAGLTATSIAGAGWACALNPLTCTRSDALEPGLSYPAIALQVNVAARRLSVAVFNRASVSVGGTSNTVTDRTILLLPTATTLVVSPSPSEFGQPVTLTAIVAERAGGTVNLSDSASSSTAGGGARIWGKVEFLDGVSPLGTATMVGGRAGLSTRLLPSGQRRLTARYLGDPSHAPNSGVASHAVVARAAAGFHTADYYFSGYRPYAIAAGDFNRDGKTDLVTANVGANTASVFLGNGDGTFAARTDYAVGTGPVAVEVGDFNNDGVPDLAVASQSGGAVNILLGNGDGTFQAAIDAVTGIRPHSLAVGDFDGDGNLDLAAADDGGIVLLFGNGDATFQRSVAPSGQSPVKLAIGDFNNDGIADIAYTVLTDTLQILLANGDGTFRVQTVIPYGTFPIFTFIVADINEDGNADIVVGDTVGVDVLLGNGDGTFQPYVRYATHDAPLALMCADVNGDGILDVAAVANGADILIGNGDGTLQPAASLAIISAASTGIVAADFNGDGATDLAVSNIGASNVAVLLGVALPAFR